MWTRMLKMTRLTFFAVLLVLPGVCAFAVEKPTADEAARIKKAEAAAVANPNNADKLEALRSALLWLSERNGG
jgi:hypothetical protein